MTIVHTVIAREIATLSRRVATPQPPFGFGRDLRCVTDVTERLDEVDPESPIAIVESLIRRLTTPRGLVPDLPNDGLDLRQHLNRGTTPTDLAALRGRIQSEATKDDRVQRVQVAVAFPSTREMRVEIQFTPANPALQTFSATLAITTGAVALEALR